VSHHPKTERPCQDCGLPFLGTAPARFCPNCRWRHRGRKPKKYPWTPERDQVLRDRYDGKVKGKAAELAALVGWPTWVIKKRAATLGLCYAVPRQDWTQEEERFLWEHAGHRLSHWIAKQLHRSETSVVLKLKRMKISRRFRDGYTLRELELCFGTDHHVIERWVREEKLRVRRRDERGDRKSWCVSDDALLTFIRDYPLSFRLDKVDQVWFMDLITSGALLRKALAVEEKLEAS